MAQPIITDKIAGQNKKDYHLITTTHPYLIELGLGSFTIPSLSAWWNEKSHNGVYLHRTCINNTRVGLDSPDNNLGDLLGISTDTKFFWNGWKPNKDLENAGIYVKYDLSTYNDNTGGDSPWTFSSAVGEVAIDDTLISTVSNPTQYILGGTLDDGLDFKHTVYDYDPANGLEHLSPIYDVVNLNRYMSAFSDFHPRSTWDKDEPNSNVAGQNTKKLFASHEFLVDIKTSKLGPYIEWSGEVTFYINEGHLCDQGITEWIPFRLHLFDSPSSDVSANTITLKSLKYVAPRRDVTGKLFGGRADGGHTEYNPDDVASQGVGDLDLSLNPITKKWEGGSPTLFAKMVTDIGKPSVPTVDRLETNDVQADLDSDDYEGVKFIPTTGTAMPIRPQNGNPLQWQPNYLEPNDVRCKTGNTEKETLTVYNFSTQRQFSRDEEVMLTRIDGVWHVSALGVNLIEEDEATGAVGKWGEFTYMMTNSRFFFKDKERNDFTPREAELFFHKLYYAEDPVNTGLDYGTAGGWDKISTFNTNDIKEVYLDNGYAQTTSFDYLDKRLCGIRGKENENGDSWDDACSISTTNATLNAAGHTIPGPDSWGSRNAAHSAVFFGCVFPEGYVDTSPHLVKGRGYDISAKSVGEAGVVTTTNYIDPQAGNNTVATLSAIDGSVDRNNCRLPTRARFDEQLSDSNNHWERYRDEHSASLFYGHAVDKNQSCIQFPADVMTNASPTGKNGSPLYPVHRFKDFHTESTDKYNEVSKAFLQGIWLGKGDGGEDVVSKYDSAFDFTPKKRDTLMFRPLKLEGYVQFGDNMLNPGDNWVEDLSVTRAREFRKGFSIEAHRTQKDNKRPCTAIFEDREKDLSHEDLWTQDYGLKWGGDVEDEYNDRAVQRSYSKLHEFYYWDRSNGPLQWTRDQQHQQGDGKWSNRGGHAFGIITTFNTVTANERIDFSTNNIYGMGVAGHGDRRFSISNGHQYQNKTWGVSELRDSYRQENIPDLSVRIYQQHPRDQTLFDPRTFAVHHFNPDVRYANDQYMKDDGETENFLRTWQLSTEIDGVHSNGQNIKYQYYYQDSFSVVDLRRMTRNAWHINPELGESHGNLGQYSPIAVQADEYIFSDLVYNGTESPYKFGPVMAEKYWVIDSSRTGKLLPFKYLKQEVGISIPVGTKFVIDGTGSPDDPAQHLDTLNFNNTLASGILGKMCVKSRGTGYVAGDTVGLDDIVFRVEDVEENVGDTQGAIRELKCISRGTGFSESQTAAHDDPFNPETNGPITLGTLSSDAGKGFDAYFVSISVYYVEKIDPKPYLMKRDGEEIVRVASDVSQSTGPDTGHDAAAEAGAFVNETHGISYTLDPTLYSDNKEYDVFFHFHNDITMTWMASQEHFHGASPSQFIGNNQTPAHEQHITVNINPR